MSFLSDLLGDKYKEGMTEEEISAALEGMNTDYSKEIDHYKALLSKANSEASDYKKQLRGKQTEAEAAEAERKAELQKLQDENARLTKDIQVGKLQSQYVSMGYAPDKALAAAKSIADGKFEDALKIQSEFIDETKKNAVAEAMRGTPRPSAGGNAGTATDYTKLIEEATKAGNDAAVAHYYRLAQEEANQPQD